MSQPTETAIESISLLEVPAPVPKKPELNAKEKAMRYCLFDFIKNLPEGASKEQMFALMHLRESTDDQIAFYEPYTVKEKVAQVHADLKAYLRPPKNSGNSATKKPRASSKKETVLGDQSVDQVVQVALTPVEPAQVSTLTKAPKKAPKEKVAVDLPKPVELFPEPVAVTTPVRNESNVDAMVTPKAPMKKVVKKPSATA